MKCQAIEMLVETVYNFSIPVLMKIIDKKIQFRMFKLKLKLHMKNNETVKN